MEEIIQLLTVKAEMLRDLARKTKKLKKFSTYYTKRAESYDLAIKILSGATVKRERLIDCLAELNIESYIILGDNIEQVADIILKSIND